MFTFVAKFRNPNVITYNTFIKTCNHPDNNDLTGALDALERMLSRGVMPNEKTFSSLIAGVARNGSRDPDEAFRLFDEMKSLRIRPNAITYCALIDVCKRCYR